MVGTHLRNYGHFKNLLPVDWKHVFAFRIDQKVFNQINLISQLDVAAPGRKCIMLGHRDVNLYKMYLKFSFQGGQPLYGGTNPFFPHCLLVRGEG